MLRTGDDEIVNDEIELRDNRRCNSEGADTVVGKEAVVDEDTVVGEDTVGHKKHMLVKQIVATMH